MIMLTTPPDDSSDTTSTRTSTTPLRSHSLMSVVGMAQALYFVVTGLWPILSITTFEVVTGPKTDDWLVQTVGVLISIVAVVIAVAAARKNISFEILLLAIGSAVGLAIVDLVFVAQGIISKVYLLDAIAEFIIIGLWISAIGLQKRQRSTPESASV